jgi:hypothetical protein
VDRGNALSYAKEIKSMIKTMRNIKAWNVEQIQMNKGLERVERKQMSTTRSAACTPIALYLLLKCSVFR